MNIGRFWMRVFSSTYRGKGGHDKIAKLVSILEPFPPISCAVVTLTLQKPACSQSSLSTSATQFIEQAFVKTTTPKAATKVSIPKWLQKQAECRCHHFTSCHTPTRKMHVQLRVACFQPVTGPLLGKDVGGFKNKCTRF